MTADAPALFAGMPEETALYRAFLRQVLDELEPVEVSPQKTQVTLRNPRVFACVSLLRARPKRELPVHYVTVTLGLGRPLDSPRIAQKVEPYPGRWTHHIVVSSPDEVDDELMTWVREAYAFALAK